MLPRSHRSHFLQGPPLKSSQGRVPPGGLLATRHWRSSNWHVDLRQGRIEDSTQSTRGSDKKPSRALSGQSGVSVSPNVVIAPQPLAGQLSHKIF